MSETVDVGRITKRHANMRTCVQIASQDLQHLRLQAVICVEKQEVIAGSTCTPEAYITGMGGTRVGLSNQSYSRLVACIGLDDGCRIIRASIVHYNLLPILVALDQDALDGAANV
jgi:hypothetical protein